MNTITITLNGEKKVIQAPMSLASAILEWSSKDRSCAVAINEQFIPKSNYSETTLVEGDRVELLVPMQGG